MVEPLKKYDKTKLEVEFKVKSVDSDPRISPVVFTEDDFKDKSPLVVEILSYEKRII